MNEGDVANTLPSWADRELSERLPALAAGGERQDLEFKERFPEHVRDLGKEIAALATSNAGTIVVGISDAGDIVGLPECATHEGRSKIVQRIEGICANGVKPALTPTIRFGVVGSLVVVAIEVAKGDSPLYYAGNVPYLRQITAARPAEPQEVIDRVLAWDRARNQDSEESPEATFISQVATLVIDVLVYAGELDERDAKPWIDELRNNLSWLAGRARDLAVDAPTECSDMIPALETLASNLDRAAHERLFIGAGWDEMQNAAGAAMETASAIRSRWIDTKTVSEASIDGVQDVVATTSRKLNSLASRLEAMDEQNRLDEIQSEASQHGLLLLKAATFGLGLGGPDSLAELTSIGRLLRDVETRRLPSDGGQSVARILADIRRASATLTEWLQRLNAQ